MEMEGGRKMRRKGGSESRIRMGGENEDEREERRAWGGSVMGKGRKK